MGEKLNCWHRKMWLQSAARKCGRFVVLRSTALIVVAAAWCRPL